MRRDSLRMPKKHPVRPHLRAWREHFGLTLEAVAEQIGKAHTSVMRWENGTAGVDDKTFAEIARVYGLSVAELSARPNEREKAQQLDRLLRAIRDLDAEGLGAIATMAERMRA